MGKYIDAEKLIAEINNRLMSVNLEELRNFGCHRVWAYNDVKDLITSLQREQPSLPSNLEGTAENTLNNYKPILREPQNGLSEGLAYYSILQMLSMFKAGAKWMAEKGVSYTAEIQDLGGLTIAGLPDTVERNLGFFDGDTVIVQIRKAK